MLRNLGQENSGHRATPPRGSVQSRNKQTMQVTILMAKSTLAGVNTLGEQHFLGPAAIVSLKVQSAVQ